MSFILHRNVNKKKEKMEKGLSDEDKKRVYQVYMREYMAKRYKRDRDLLKRKQNSGNALKCYEIPPEIRTKYGNYLYNVIKINEFMKDMPDDLVQLYLEEDRNLSFKKK